jgi:hypothetical protein
MQAHIKKKKKFGLYKYPSFIIIHKDIFILITWSYTTCMQTIVLNHFLIKEWYIYNTKTKTGFFSSTENPALVLQLLPDPKIQPCGMITMQIS